MGSIAYKVPGPLLFPISLTLILSDYVISYSIKSQSILDSIVVTPSTSYDFVKQSVISDSLVVSPLTYTNNLLKLYSITDRTALSDYFFPSLVLFT